MSNGWIPMPLNALSFALQLANVVPPDHGPLDDSAQSPAPQFEFEGLTDEVARYFLRAADDDSRLAA